MTIGSRPNKAMVLGGFVVAAYVLALVLGIPRGDAASLVLVSFAAAFAAGVIGLGAIQLRARATMRSQMVTTSLTLMSIVVAGIVAAAAAMFLSGPDLDALLVTATVACGVTIAVALCVGDRVGADARAVEAVLRPGPAGEAAIETVRTAELHALARHLRTASQDLAGALERERSIERTRRELVSWISHDLRSPLASIRALAEALEDDIVTSPEDVRRYHRTIRRQTDELATLVDDLFELSRVHAGVVENGTTDLVSPIEVLEDALAGVHRQAAERKVTLHTETHVRVDRLVPAHDLLRVLRNLLDNAVRHTPPGGRVEVGVRCDETGISFTVVDECGGIPADDLPRVFEVGFRGDTARARDDSGHAGLGLAIARGLIELLDGTIAVCNVGAGCCFEVRLPGRLA